LPRPTTSTFDEARVIREYAVAHRFRSLIVVTSPYHSRRALWTLDAVFRGSGITIGMEPVVRVVGSPPAAYWWLKRNGWRFVPTEYVKLVYYAFRRV
jgi:uncharacterized SAM-binding protein YcdF (DUF218 family)